MEGAVANWGGHAQSQSMVFKYLNIWRIKQNSSGKETQSMGCQFPSLVEMAAAEKTVWE